MKLKLRKDIDTQVYNLDVQTIETAQKVCNLEQKIVEDFRQGNASLLGFDSALQNENAEFVYIPFRALSEEIVAPYTYRAADFRKEGVLKASTPKLSNKGLYTNHHVVVENNKGLVVNPSYGESFNFQKRNVPAGINAFARLHSKRETTLIAKMTSDPPELNAFSVGVEISVERSHPNLDAEDWEYSYYYVGTIVDGSMVRWVVNEIIAYDEVSIVYDGASETSNILDVNGVPFDFLNTDPSLFTKFAKKQVRKRVSPTVDREAFKESFRKTGVYINCAKTERVQQKIDFMRDKDNSNQVNQDWRSYAILVKGKEHTFIAKESDIDAISDLQTTTKNLEFDLNALNEKYDRLSEKNAELEKLNKAMQSEYDEYKEGVENERNVQLSKLKEQAKSAYHRVGGENDSYLNLIDNTNDVKSLEAIIEANGQQLQNEFQALAHCNNCDSSKYITYRKSEKASGETESNDSDSILNPTAELAKDKASK